MEYSSDSIDKALGMLESGIRDEAIKEVKNKLRGVEGESLYAFLGMRVFGAENEREGARLLDIGLVYDSEVMTTTNIRDELLEGFGDDPEFYAEKIKATAAELRALANELEALQS